MKPRKEPSPPLNQADDLFAHSARDPFEKLLDFLLEIQMGLLGELAAQKGRNGPHVG